MYEKATLGAAGLEKWQVTLGGDELYEQTSPGETYLETGGQRDEEKRAGHLHSH